MTYRARERLAFWIEQACALGIAVASIWYAARIGYTEAVRYARYDELRKERNLLRAMEGELAFNEESLRRTLRDWDHRALQRGHVNAPCFQALRESKEYVLISPDTWEAVTRAYEGILEADLDPEFRFRGRGVDGAYHRPAFLAFKAEQFRDARALIEKLIARTDERMRGFGIHDPFPPKRTQPEPVPPRDAEEEGFARRPASPGWGTGAPEKYEGPVGIYRSERRETVDSSSLCVPARARGPVVIEYALSLPKERRPARLWLFLTERYPLEWRAHDPKADEETLRALVTGKLGGRTTVLNYPLSPPTSDIEHRPQYSFNWGGQILDTRDPLPWNWAYVTVEDDQGHFYLALSITAWKIKRKTDPDDDWKLNNVLFRTRLSPHVLVLPGPGSPDGRTGRLADPSLREGFLACGDAKIAEGHRAAVGSPPLHYYRLAERDFSAAINLDPQRADAWVRRGFVRTYLWDFDGAVADLTRARELGEANAEAALARARLFREDQALISDLWSDAPDQLRLHERGQELSQKGEDARGRTDFPAAATFFKSAFYVQPWQSAGKSASYHAACCFSLLGKADRALDWIEVALAHGYDDWLHLLTDEGLKPLHDSPRWRTLTGEKRTQLGPKVRQRELYNKLSKEDASFLKKPPLNAGATFKLCDQAYEWLVGKEYAKAIEAYKTAFYSSLQANFAVIAYNLACAYALTGEKERALDWLEMAILGGYSDWDHLKKDSDLDSLREEPRYKALLRGK
ncbi:MAG: hypothetical protein HYY17_12960 [Planctomycetes bacterium]|nr:hypothetical protein [Planctomycetota bacterium]